MLRLERGKKKNLKTKNKTTTTTATTKQIFAWKARDNIYAAE